MTTRRFALVVGILVAARVVLVAAALHGLGPHPGTGLLSYDATQYHRVASAAGRAWRDFAVPFPPVGFLAMKLVNASTLARTLPRLAWSQLVCELLVAGALLHGWGRRSAVAYLALDTVFLVKPIPYFRIDLVSVAFAVWGVALLRRRRDVGAGLVLALGVMTKVWPFALVPATLSERRPRAFLACAASGALGLAAWVLYGGTGGPGQVLTLRGARGWEVESVAGSLWQVFGGGRPRFEVGAWRIGLMPAWSRTPLFLAMVATVVVVWVLAARTPVADVARRDGLAPLVAVTAFLVLSPIISPQYLLWLTPFAAIAWAHGARRAAALTAGACAVTMLLVTFRYPGIVQGDALAELLLVVRNLALVAVLVLGLQDLAAGTRPPGEARDSAGKARRRGPEPATMEGCSPVPPPAPSPTHPAPTSSRTPTAG